MAFLDTTIANIAFPALQRAFPGEPTASISWVLNAYNIVFAALLVSAGTLADRYTRRTLFMIGLALFTLCDILFMTSVWHYSELNVGLAVSASPLITAAVASTAARVAIRIGIRPAAALSAARGRRRD